MAEKAALELKSAIDGIIDNAVSISAKHGENAGKMAGELAGEQVAVEKARDVIKTCVESNEQVAALASNATTEERHQAYQFASKLCRESSEKACIKFGGAEDECSVEKQQEKGVEEDMTTCIKNNEALNTEKAKQNFNLKSDKSKELYRKARLACDKEVEENYIKSGGNVKKLAEKILAM